jgi:hypothetical protein
MKNPRQVAKTNSICWIRRPEEKWQMGLGVRRAFANEWYSDKDLFLDSQKNTM